MIEKKRCPICQGSGTLNSGGMMKKNCHECSGSGEIKVPLDDISYLMNKKGKHYKSAKKRIKALNAKISDEEAEDILDTELEKLDKEESPKEVENVTT